MTLGSGLGSTGHLSRVTTNYVIQGTCERHRESVRKDEKKREKSGNRLVQGEEAQGTVSGTHLIWVPASGGHCPTQSQSLSPVTWSADLGPLATKPSMWNDQLGTSPHFPFSAYSWITFEDCIDCKFGAWITTTQNSPLVLPRSNSWLCPLLFTLPLI